MFKTSLFCFKWCFSYFNSCYIAKGDNFLIYYICFINSLFNLKIDQIVYFKTFVCFNYMYFRHSYNSNVAKIWHSFLFSLLYHGKGCPEQQTYDILLLFTYSVFMCAIWRMFVTVTPFYILTFTWNWSLRDSTANCG